MSERRERTVAGLVAATALVMPATAASAAASPDRALPRAQVSTVSTSDALLFVRETTRATNPFNTWDVLVRTPATGVVALTNAATEQGAAGFGGYGYLAPRVSPGGTAIAMIRREASTTLAFVRDVASGTTHRIGATCGEGHVSGIDWLQDGSLLLTGYTRSSEGINGYSASADGATCTPLTWLPNGAGDAVVSPDRTRVAIAAYDATAGTSAVWVANVDGTNARAVTPATTAGIGSPAWSPDGTRLAVTVGEGNVARVGTFSVPASGTVTATVVDGIPAPAQDPVFTSDGGGIIYARGPGRPAPGPYGLVRWDGSTNTALTSGRDMEPSLVSPTGAAPAPVTALSATPGGSAATLTWTNPTASGRLASVVRGALGTAAPASPTAGTVGAVTRGATARVAVTPGRTYSFAVFTVDLAGRWSSAATKTVVAMPVPSLAVGDPTATTSTGLPFPVAWAATGATRYTVQWTRRVLAGGTWSTAPWTTWLAGTSARSATFGGADQPTAVSQGTTYYLRAFATDAYGNTTAPRLARATVAFDERSSWLVYSAGWTTSAATGRWLGTLRATSHGGGSMQGAAAASSFALLGDRCPQCGWFRVYVDGVLRATVSSYATTARARQLLWRSPSLGAPATHKLRVVAAGTAGHPRVALDAVAVSR